MISAVAAQNRTLPSPGKLIERANEIGTVAHKRAVEIEEARRCPDDIVQMMHDAELFRVMQPAKFGGFECGWEVFIETVAAIASFEKVSRGEPISVDFRMRNRLTHTFSAKLLTQAVDVCFAALGGSALGLHHPVQRFWRDVHAVASHISLNWDAVGATYGQHAFGLEPKGQY